MAKIGGNEVSIERENLVQAVQAVQASGAVEENVVEAVSEVKESHGVSDEVPDKLVDRLEEAGLEALLACDEAAMALESDIESSGPRLKAIAHPSQIGFMILNVADRYMSGYRIRVMSHPATSTKRWRTEACPTEEVPRSASRDSVSEQLPRGAVCWLGRSRLSPSCCSPIW
ncbi:hypothetical protein [Sinomonas sp. G460-2]|uniref:hypothetical protein n=1 Tax=Sinomonas sp. G460-2 TaxID=3393464 RepID=UPI0039F0C322